MANLPATETPINSHPSSGGNDLFALALARAGPASGGEVEIDDAANEAIAREYNFPGGKLSDPTTIHTVTKALTSELQYILQLQKNPEETIDPWMNRIYKQVARALNKEEGQPMSNDEIFGAIESMLKSKDPVTSRLLEEISDRVMKVQLARIQVRTGGELDLTSPSKELQFTPLETRVPSLVGFGNVKRPSPEEPESTKNKLIGWMKAEPTREFVLNVVGKVPFIGRPLTTPKDVYQDWQNKAAKTAKKYFNGFTPDFPPEATMDYTSKLNGSNRDHYWIQSLPEITADYGAAITSQQKIALGRRMVDIGAAITEISARRHGKATVTKEDFIYAKPKVDDNDKPIPNEFETAGRGRENVLLHIEGLEQAFPVDFVAMSPDEQLNMLTEVLDKKERGEFEQIQKSEFIDGKTRMQVSELEGELERSKDPHRFDEAINTQQQAVEDLTRREQAIDNYTSTKKQQETQDKEVEELNSGVASIKQVLDSLTTAHSRFDTQTAERDKSNSQLSAQRTLLQQLTAQLADLRIQQSSESPPADIADRFKEVSESLSQSTKKISEIEQQIIDIDQKLAKVADDEARYAQLRAQLNQKKAQLHQETIAQQDVSRLLSRQQDNLFEICGLQGDKDDKDDKEYQNTLAELQKSFLANLKIAKEETARRKAEATKILKELQSRAGKPDAGLQWRLERLTNCREMMIDSKKYGNIEQRISQGKVDISFDEDHLNDTSSHASADIIRAAHRAMPGLPPAYLHAIYVFAGREALAQTDSGRALFEKAVKLLTPEEFYGYMRQKAGCVTKLQGVLGLKGGEELPGSIFDGKFFEPKVMNEMLGMMDEEFLEGMVDQVLRYAQEGFGSGKFVPEARLIAENQAELDSEKIEIRLLEEVKLSEWAQFETAIAVAKKFHETSIRIGNIALSTQIDHSTTLIIAGQIKSAMDNLNIMKMEDVASQIDALEEAVKDSIPDKNEKDQVISKKELVKIIASYLLEYQGTGSDLIRQGERLGQIAKPVRDINKVNELLKTATIGQDGSVTSLQEYSKDKYGNIEEEEMKSNLSSLLKSGYIVDAAVFAENKSNIQFTGNILERYRISHNLIKTMMDTLPQTPELKRQLMILSAVLPSLDESSLKQLAEKLRLAFIKGKNQGLEILFDLPGGKSAENIFNQRVTEICAKYNQQNDLKDQNRITDISRLTLQEILDLSVIIGQLKYDLPDEHYRTLLRQNFTDKQRSKLVRHYDKNMFFYDQAQLANAIMGDMGFFSEEALMITRLILEKRKLRNSSTPLPSSVVQ